MSRSGLGAALKARLIESGVAGGRVSLARTIPHQSGGVFPRVDVYVGAGTGESRSANIARFREVWDVSLYCWAQASTDDLLDAAIDAVTADAKASIFTSGALRSAYQMTGQTRTAVSYDAETDGRVARSEFTFSAAEEITYVIDAQADGPPLETVAITASAGAPSEYVPTASGTVTDLDEAA